MNAKSLLTLLAFAAAAATGAARADEADASQFVIKFDSNRTRAEVQAEAATVPATRSIEPAGSRVLQPVRSTVDVKDLRAATMDALRLGKIPSGEASF
jgi:hypothetical protein